MRRSFRTTLFSVFFAFVAGAACGPTEQNEQDPEGECQVNADCPGENNVCDLLTNTCSNGDDPSPDTGTEDTGGAPEDTGTRDTYEPDPDTGVEPVDTGTDTGTVDTFEPEDTGTEDTYVPEDTAPPEDTNPPRDTAVADTGVDTGRDTGVDTGMDVSDSGMDVRDTQPDIVDSGMDTGTDTGMDTGQPNYSGCSTDADCSGYLVCDSSVSNGRCKDPRTKCSSNSDCSGSQACVYGRCAKDCSGLFSSCSSGLSCETFSSGSSSAELCVDTCNTFDGTGVDACGEDTQCVPFFGSGEGLCRGVGANRRGDSCKMDYSTDGCSTGNLCTNNRGTKTCKPLCSSSGNPGCGSGEYCNNAFAYDRSDQEVSDPAGVCREDCGGLGNTNNSQCSGSKQCQPDSASHGYCTNAGSASAGQDCGYPGTPYCKVGNYCMAASSQGKGTCRGLCDPSTSQANNACTSSQACVEVSSNFGICLTMCSNTGTSSGNSCPSERPYCGQLRSGVNTTPSTSGACFVN